MAKNLEINVVQKPMTNENILKMYDNLSMTQIVPPLFLNSLVFICFMLFVYCCTIEEKGMINFQYLNIDCIQKKSIFLINIVLSICFALLFFSFFHN